MPKIAKFPRLRTKVYRSAAGKVYVYYTYDMRPLGKPDIRLGTDYEKAIQQWQQLHHDLPLTIGRIEEAFARFAEHEILKYDSAETRRGYTKNLRALRPVFGQMAWDEVTLPVLHQYLDLRTAKTQGNREMSLFRVVWGKALLWGMTRLPWPAVGVRNWKNQERPREFQVTPEMFGAVYAEGDQILRDCMDIASATGMRLTDVTRVRMPVDGVLTFRANKTSKAASFVVEESPVLADVVARRRALACESVLLLCSRNGTMVTMAMLRGRWDDARDRAALKAENAELLEFGASIRKMFLRDMRSLAADLAGSARAASELLQHSSQSLIRKHYRLKADALKAVR